MLKKILLVDDDSDEYSFFMEALASLDGYMCIYAESPQKAFAILREVTPDYIFLDFNMPETSGLECLCLIRDNESFAEIPIYIYSTHIDEELCSRAKADGAAGCIRKPHKVEILLDQLRNIAEMPV